MSCCKANPVSREHGPCDPGVCCCTPSRALECGYCEDRALMAIRPGPIRHAPTRPDPMQVKDVREVVDMKGIHRELIELNKHFRLYFKKTKKNNKGRGVCKCYTAGSKGPKGPSVKHYTCPIHRRKRK